MGVVFFFLLNPEVSLLLHLPSVTQAKSCEPVLHSDFEARFKIQNTPLFLTGIALEWLYVKYSCWGLFNNLNNLLIRKSRDRLAEQLCNIIIAGQLLLKSEFCHGD